MKSQTQNQKNIKKLMARYSKFTKMLQYELVAEDLGIKPRLAQYIANDPERKVPETVEKLLRVLAQ